MRLQLAVKILASGKGQRKVRMDEATSALTGLIPEYFPAALRERAERVLSVRDRVRRERGSNLASFRFDLLKGEEYRQEADRQKLLVKKAEETQSRLLFIVETIRELTDDENFANLL